MPRYVAFLRGINLGKRRPPMARLRSLFEELGFGAVETFIASGNVIFSARAADSNRLESRIAAHLEESLGYGVDTFARTLDEIAAIAKGKVFPEDGAGESRSTWDSCSGISGRTSRAGLPPSGRRTTSFA
jgi:uncharacterized protein (DUF1697 family)